MAESQAKTTSASKETTQAKQTTSQSTTKSTAKTNIEDTSKVADTVAVDDTNKSSTEATTPEISKETTSDKVEDKHVSAPAHEVVEDVIKTPEYRCAKLRRVCQIYASPYEQCSQKVSIGGFVFASNIIVNGFTKIHYNCPGYGTKSGYVKTELLQILE